MLPYAEAGSMARQPSETTATSYGSRPAPPGRRPASMPPSTVRCQRRITSEDRDQRDDVLRVTQEVCGADAVRDAWAAELE
jgi:hypothetical protein